MKFNHYRNIIIKSLGFTVFSFVGCRKYVEITPPNVSLVASTVFSSNATATAAMTAIYTSMNTNQESYFMSLSTGLLGDELKNYSNSSSQIQLYTNAMSSLNTSGSYGCWNNAYNYIYQANAVLAGIINNSAINTTIQKQLVGEAKFIRAFWHFYLTNSFGDVPIVTATDYKANALLARSPQSAVYQQIIADLTDAENLLNQNFVDASDTTITPDRSRPTKWAASALLARVYLYTGDYVHADSLSSIVINNSALFGLVQDLRSVFLANSEEAIWQLAIPQPSFINTPDGFNYILLDPPGLTGSVTVSSQLMKSFEAGDSRQANWIGILIDSSVTPSDTFYFPFKYQVSSSSSVTENVMVLRLSEQMLIRAEAKVHEGNISGPTGALSDINKIRARANLAPYSGPTDPTSVLNVILHERRVELFTEWGHRWFDLIRTNNINTVMGLPGNVCSYKGGAWVTTDQLFPIPQSDRKADPNLTQNPGY